MIQMIQIRLVILFFPYKNSHLYKITQFPNVLSDGYDGNHTIQA